MERGFYVTRRNADCQKCSNKIGHLPPHKQSKIRREPRNFSSRLVMSQIYESQGMNKFSKTPTPSCFFTKRYMANIIKTTLTVSIPPYYAYTSTQNNLIGIMNKNMKKTKTKRLVKKLKRNQQVEQKMAPRLSALQRSA